MQRAIVDGSLVTGRSPERRSVLVLGAGFIGGAVGQALLANGHRVSVLSRSPLDDRRGELLEGATMIVGDVGDDDHLAEALDAVDEVVWTVGSSSPAESDRHPAADIAAFTVPVVHLLELLARRPGIGLTFVSSGGTVYGDPVGLPIPEHAPLRPIGSYGIVKVACEHYLGMYNRVHDVPARVARVANAYGPGQRPVRQQGLIAHLLRSASTGMPPQLFGSPEAIRDYVYIDDIGAAVAALAVDRAGPDVVNIGSGVGHSVHDVVKIVEEVTGADLTAFPQPSRPCDVGANVLDISLLRTFCAFDPVDLRAGVERTWKDLLDRDDLDAADQPLSATA